jgi:hypothetical protein
MLCGDARRPPPSVTWHPEEIGPFELLENMWTLILNFKPHVKPLTKAKGPKTGPECVRSNAQLTPGF